MSLRGCYWIEIFNGFELTDDTSGVLNAMDIRGISFACTLIFCCIRKSLVGDYYGLYCF